jgi:hypothetical protein
VQFTVCLVNRIDGRWHFEIRPVEFEACTPPPPPIEKAFIAALHGQKLAAHSVGAMIIIEVEKENE